jgi:hypothetical protein
MPALSENSASDSDRAKVTLQEFLVRKQEIDARTSLTISQLYVVTFTSALVIVVLGLAGQYFLGFFWGAIFASVFSCLAILTITGRMRNSNFRASFGGQPGLKKEAKAKDEQIDDYVDS